MIPQNQNRNPRLVDDVVVVAVVAVVDDDDGGGVASSVGNLNAGT